jgi:protein-L-isoaspartate(D-aspartate) O-methyltransferase
MLEQLDPQPGDRVLEIGAGTGYNAALLAHIVGHAGSVVTLDLDEDLVLAAQEHLALAGYADVRVVQTDGALGYALAQPYDRVILTVASGDIAPAWREQLGRPNGRLVMPLAIAGLQRCVAFTWMPSNGAGAQSEPGLIGDCLRNCSFISLRGMLAAGVSQPRTDGEGPWLGTSDDQTSSLAPETLIELLSRPLRISHTGLAPALEELRQGLHLWLVAHHAGVRTIWGGPRLPDLFGYGERAAIHGTLCLADSARRALALLAWSADAPGGGDLCVLSTNGAEHLSQQWQRLLQGWENAGRPRDADAQLRAYPRASAPPLGPGEVAVEAQWTRFLLSWRR